MLPAFLTPSPRPARRLVPAPWSARWRRFRRRPLVHGAFAVLVAATSGLFVWRLVSRAEAAAARYGSMVEAPVARRDVAAGSIVTSGDVRWERMPRAFVPRGGGALRPVGRTTTAAVMAGEVIVENRLAPHGVRGAAALIPPGARALAVPAGPGTPRVARGDHVDLLAAAVGGDGDGGSSTASRVVAQRAVVIETADDAVTVAVTSAEAPAVAAALARGGVTVALVGA